MVNYRFDLASQALHQFIWNEFCDWYLELSKPILWDEDADPAYAEATRWALLTTLEKSLRLLHPFMPFITEEIWQRVAPLLQITGDSVMLQAYPVYDHARLDTEAEDGIEWIKVLGIKKQKSSSNYKDQSIEKHFLQTQPEISQRKIREISTGYSYYDCLSDRDRKSTAEC